MLSNQNIVFLDSRVENFDTLKAGIVPGTEVIVLKSDKPTLKGTPSDNDITAQRNGIEQITEVLNQKPYSTVHIVSHGSPGCLYLGNTQLSLATLAQYKSSLKTWFSPSPRLLIYGCNVAAGDAGEEFIAKLHKITGAEIAASTTPIGNADLGGNWELDFATSAINTTLAITKTTQHNYAGILAYVVSGTAFNDYDSDGVNDGTARGVGFADESGYEGIIVTAYDSTETVVGTATTDTDGTYTLNVNTSDAVRLEFSLPEGYVVGGLPGSAETVANVAFVDSTTTVDLGIHRPHEATTGDGSSIELVTVCYVEGVGSAAASAIVIHDYNDFDDQNQNAYTKKANYQEIGSVNGLAYHRESETLFAGSFYKRHSALLGTIDYTNDNNASADSNDATGAAYTSIIYTVDNSNSNTSSNVSIFARLDDVTDPRGAIDSDNFGGGNYSWDTDQGTSNDTAGGNAVFDAVGKYGLGDIELSEDGKTLWAVNLNDRKLYQVPVGDSSDPLTPSSPNAGDIDSYDLINQIINNGDDLGINPEQNIRPFALSIKDGLVYFGMVNTAQYDADGNEGTPNGVGGTDDTTSAADLRGYVYTFDPNNLNAAPTQILDIPLNYERDFASNTSLGAEEPSANWHPWVGTFPTDTITGTGEEAYTQPILSDIDFDPDGNMLLGFRDRWGDQTGQEINRPDGSGNADLTGNAGGDLLVATFDQTTGDYTIETHVTTDNINGNNDPDGELFDNEFFENGNANDSSELHSESGQGGLTVVPGFTEVVTTAEDPIDGFTGGFEWFNTEDGSFAGHFASNGDSGLDIYNSNTDTGTFGKSNGLGDLEFIADATKITIGDRIWNDTNQDGIQNAGETNFDFDGNGTGSNDTITLELYNSNGTLVDTTTTSDGKYYFSNLNPFTDYEVRLAASNFTSGAALEGYSSTVQNTGSNDDIDSDAADSGGIPSISFTTGASGKNDYSLDFGLTSATTIDYGDAPDTTSDTDEGDYQTTATNSGASHTLGSGLTIGSGVTADDGTLQNTDADADSDDGVTFPSTLQTTDSTFSVDVDVNLPTNISASDNFSSGNYTEGRGWLGDWTEVGESSSNPDTGQVTLQNGILQITNDDTEIYRQIDLSNATGDATLSFNYSHFSLDADNEGYEIVVSDNLGGTETVVKTIERTEPGTTANQTADEFDSVTIPLSFLTSTTTITLRPRNLRSQGDFDFAYLDNVKITAPGVNPANLVGWIDFDQSGTFDDDEDVTTTNITSSGTQTLTWNSFPGIVDGTTYSRFRLSTDTDLDDTFSTGALDDGEVEDYKITVGRDYGDAPDTSGGTAAGDYQTTSANTGASHGILEGLSIGSIVDADNGTLENTDADNDDIDGSDDEDGVTFTTNLSPNDDSYSVDVDVTNSTGEDAVLTSWIDFDQSGTFDTTERVSAVVSDSGTETLTWDTSSLTIPTGTTYARFRLSQDFTSTTESITTPVTTTQYAEDFSTIPSIGTDSTDWKINPNNNDGADTAAEGQWEIGDPDPYFFSGDPYQLNAFNDSNALITSLDPSQSGDGSDVDNGVTTARSRDFDLSSGSGLHNISFQYYLGFFDTGDAATTDNQFITRLVKSSNDEVIETFNNEVLTVNQTSAWTQFNQSFDLSTYPNESVYLEFIAEDSTPNDFLYAGIDDINVTYTEDVTTSVDIPNPLDSTGALDDGEVEDYKINVGIDYGDAPDTTNGTGEGDYQTTADNGGASHVIDQDLTIGTNLDADDGTLQNTDADADNTDNTNDEDGVTFASNLEIDDTSYTATVKATNDTGSLATLVGWIDFNQNGQFESSEAVTANVPDGTDDGDVTLTWDNIAGSTTGNLSGNGDLPATILPGTTYARFRLSTDTDFDGDNALGAAGDGEVEDYKLTVGIDYGDARDTQIGTGVSNYNTTAKDNGASHIIDPDLSIGNFVDADDGTLQNAEAIADDKDGFNLGILNYEYFDLPSGQNTVDAIPESGLGIKGTLDPDSNLVTQANQGDADNYGIRYDGYIYIETAGIYTFYTTSDDGSTLSIDNTLVVNNDGLHGATTVSGNYTFSEPGYYPIEVEFFEATGGQSLTLEYESSDDDINITRQNIPGSILAGSDEDGVLIANTLRTDSISYDVTVDINNDTGEDATLIGWIDFDQSGTFDADEATTATFAADATNQTLSWATGTIPEDITDGITAARFRLSTDEDLDINTATGQLSDGEVEDYKIDIVAVDYGDAPDIATGTSAGEYKTTLADDGARHLIVDGLKLGETVDAEQGTLQNTAADADDNDNNNDDDDEDGVTFANTLSVSDATNDTDYSVTVDFTNDTRSDAEIIGWIDFDQSGTFDADEAVSSGLLNRSVLDRTQTLTWTGTDIPDDIKAGTTYARFRISNDTTTLNENYAEGELSSGEVEDYQIVIEGGTDYGDASNTAGSDSYAATTTSHSIVEGLNIGLIVDDDGTPTANDTATADDNTDTDDEDGVTFTSNLETTDTEYSVTVDVINTTGTDATLTGWIDFDQSGTFDSSEEASVTVSNSGTQTLTWSGISPTVGDTYARFRLNQVGISEDFEDTSTGWSINPEASDGADTAAEGQWEFGSPTSETRSSTNVQLAPFSGSGALVTGASANQDVDNGTTTIRSPSIILYEDTGVVTYDVSFQYYFGVVDNDGVTTSGDNQFIARLVRDSDGSTIQTFVTDTPNVTQAASWTSFSQSYNFDAQAGEKVYLEFIATDGTGSGDVIEAGIDDLNFEFTGAIIDSTGAREGGEVEDYALTITESDYGDAPDIGTGTGQNNYKTTKDDGGASHQIISGLSLGANIDADDGTLQDTDNDTGANSDDANGDTPDDEDGVTISNNLTVVDSSYSVTFDITNTTTNDAKLIGWIDFDQSGTFDADEAATYDLAGATGSVSGETLTWSSIPSDIAPGDTYARFRLSNDTSTLTTSYSTDTLSSGEVEDYKITIEAADYGDAPDTTSGTGAGDYQTTSANGGAAHGIDTNIRLGAEIDSDSGTLQNTNAAADDNNGDTPDDEDGVTSTLTDIATGDTSYSVTLDVFNDTGDSAKLIGWIDFDRSGTFDEDEAVTRTIGSTGITSSQTLTWDTNNNGFPSDIVDGTTYARFRLSTDTDTLTTSYATGILGDGEVEDYQIDIVGVDYGDAPDDGTSGNGTGDYQSTAANNGASHVIIDDLYLGGSVDADNGTLTNIDATADDDNGSDDENGVTFNETLSKNSTDYSVDLVVTNETGGDAKLVGWIDFNQDGNFEASEAVTQTISNAIGGQNISLDWTSLSGIKAGTTYARFRLTTDSDLDLGTLLDTDSVGEFDSGEVEDYQISVEGGKDYGDAPDIGSGTGAGNYETLANGGASHDIVGGIQIGDLVDEDDGTLQDGSAIADNNNINNDEDGVIFTSILEQGDTNYSVEVDVTNSTGGDAKLVGWIDFNQNGQFEASEAETVTVSSSADEQTKTLTWDTTSIAISDGATYARFRLSTDDALDTIEDGDSIGNLTDGEVEDYHLCVVSDGKGGTTGADTIEADAGGSTIAGYKGRDTLIGGEGVDSFCYAETSNGVDIIENFTVGSGGDRIHLTQILRDEVGYTGSDPVGDGYVTFEDYGTTGTMVQIDFDGTGGLLPKDLALVVPSGGGDIVENTLATNNFIF